MALIPKLIINGIRKTCFKFLWEGKIERKFPLLIWKRISKPKLEGGWGIKTPYFFGKDLVAKNL
jgi:hypothetical protein